MFRIPDVIDEFRVICRRVFKVNLLFMNTKLCTQIGPDLFCSAILFDMFKQSLAMLSGG